MDFPVWLINGESVNEVKFRMRAYRKDRMRNYPRLIPQCGLPLCQYPQERRRRRHIHPLLSFLPAHTLRQFRLGSGSSRHAPPCGSRSPSRAERRAPAQYLLAIRWVRPPPARQMNPLPRRSKHSRPRIQDSPQAHKPQRHRTPYFPLWLRKVSTVIPHDRMCRRIQKVCKLGR